MLVNSSWVAFLTALCMAICLAINVDWGLVVSQASKILLSSLLMASKAFHFLYSACD